MALAATPSRSYIDLRLIGGAVLFELGWRLGGFCPRPALTSGDALITTPTPDGAGSTKPSTGAAA